MGEFGYHLLVAQEMDPMYMEGEGGESEVLRRKVVSCSDRAFLRASRTMWCHLYGFKVFNRPRPPLLPLRSLFNTDFSESKLSCLDEISCTSDMQLVPGGW